MPQTMQNDSIVLASKVTPSPRQLEWQKIEFYAFCHFGTNTFTGKEWGDGNAAPSLFNPKKLDAEQWVKEIKNAGMRALILTCKHHDGFCLWPSKYTDYSVKNSPYKNGKGDVVKEVSDACKKYGIKFGVYLSPWDRHEKTYGQGKAYDDYFVNQLTELAENYGEIFCFWFDGACGEGKNGKKQVYDWNRYFSLIREKQPNAVLSICGTDVRWCGNEAGVARQSEWAVVPHELCYWAEKQTGAGPLHEAAPHALDTLYNTDPLIGTVPQIFYSEGLVCTPCEINMSIRPGWFWHEQEEPHGLDRLFHTYLTFVPGERPVKYIVLEEDLTQGQRIESFKIADAASDAHFPLYYGFTVGNRAICRLGDPFALQNPLTDDSDPAPRSLRLLVTGSRDVPALKTIKAY